MTRFENVRLNILAVFTLAILPLMAIAQPGQYKVGDKIEYLDYGKWETGGTYVGATPGNKQPLIRKKPNEFYPDGSQTAWEWDKIRPAPAAPKDRPPVDPIEPKDPPGKDKPIDNGGDKGDGCAAILTEADVLGYLQKNLGNDPFRDSIKKERTEKALAKMVRDCGVNFRYQTLSPFADKLSKYGAISTTIFPLLANFGPPTKQAWYIGTWLNNQQSEDAWLIIASKTGFLTIAADGTYIWKLYANDPPAKYVKGRWRPATDEEMAVSYQGGAGVVLLGAKQGYDWIVRQDRETPLKGRWIVIANINSRSQREYGFQK